MKAQNCMIIFWPQNDLFHSLLPRTISTATSEVCVYWHSLYSTGCLYCKKKTTLEVRIVTPYACVSMLTWPDTPPTCSLLYICRLMALMSSSCLRSVITESCFSWMSFSRRRRAISTSCFMEIWSSSSFSTSC